MRGVPGLKTLRLVFQVIPTPPTSHRSDKSTKSIRRPPEIPSARESSEVFRPRRNSYAFRVPDISPGRDRSKSLKRAPKLRIGRISSSPNPSELSKRQLVLRRKQIDAENDAASCLAASSGKPHLGDPNTLQSSRGSRRGARGDEEAERRRKKEERRRTPLLGVLFPQIYRLREESERRG